MKLTVTILIALAVAGSALAAPRSNATLTIRHQTHGCHNWSLDGKVWKASQTVTVARGGGVSVVNNDVMPHALIRVSGPSVTITGAAMKHMGAVAHVTFRAKGTYVFKTRAGEDYMKGITTTGPDNVLRLVVRVA
jgi:plastocyanin